MRPHLKSSTSKLWEPSSIAPKILYSFFILPVQKDKQLYLFSDWSVIFSAIKCKLLNYNIFILNPCDLYARPHVYGSILLFIPYIEDYSIFYFWYFPMFINLIFIAIIIVHFNFTSLKEYFLCLIFIFNPYLLSKIVAASSLFANKIGP